MLIVSLAVNFFNRTAKAETDPGNSLGDKKTKELVVNLTNTETFRNSLNEGNVSVTLNSQQIMGHELSHVFDKLNGNFAGNEISLSAKGVFYEVCNLEKNAMYYENILRNQAGLPLRILYESQVGNVKVTNADALIEWDTNAKPISISNLNGDIYFIK